MSVAFSVDKAELEFDAAQEALAVGSGDATRLRIVHGQAALSLVDAMELAAKSKGLTFSRSAALRSVEGRSLTIARDKQQSIPAFSESVRFARFLARNQEIMRVWGERRPGVQQYSLVISLSGRINAGERVFRTTGGVQTPCGKEAITQILADCFASQRDFRGTWSTTPKLDKIEGELPTVVQNALAKRIDDVCCFLAANGLLEQFKSALEQAEMANMSEAA